MAKDRAAGSRSLGEHGFHGLGRGSRPLSGASGRINLAIYWGTLRRQLLSRLGGTRQQPDYCLYCRWGRQALPVSQWQRIALLAAALSASVVSTAWGGVPGLYQMHLDASIWQYTGEPCAGSSCLGWVELDNNPITAFIAAGGGKLYQVHTDGTIWSYTGPPCSGSSCPGWVQLDDNPITQSIGVGGAVL